MKKIYMTPNQKVADLEVTSIIAGSLDGITPTSGLGSGTTTPTNGGSGDDEFGSAKAQGSFDWGNEW